MNHFNSCNASDIREAKIRVEKTIITIVNAMKKESSTFSKLFWKIFGVGSVYEHMKVGKADEFDIDILMKLPKGLELTLEEDILTGFVQLYLKNFEHLLTLDPQLYWDLKVFVDPKNYLLSKEMMTSFILEIFNKAMINNFPNRKIKVNNEEYFISNNQYIEPALTLTIESYNFQVNVDLVASFALDKSFWPKFVCTNNSIPSDFFAVPARPFRESSNKKLLWRLSFHIQERQIISTHKRIKAAIKILKSIRDHFRHPIHSYAIKSLFLWEACCDNSSNFWNLPLNVVVISMLHKYFKCLEAGKILDFWNPKNNLLSYVSKQELKQSKDDIALMLNDLKKHPHSDVLKYLK